MIMDDVLEIKNFLPKMYEDKIYETIYDSEIFTWNYLKSISYKGAKETSPSFFNMVFNERDQIMGDCFQFLYPLVFMIPEKTEIQVKKLLRMRLGLVPKCSKNIIHPPHIDYPGEEHYTALYYLNDSDGDTYVYKQVDGEHPKENFFIKKRIKPEKGKFAVFNGKYYHSSSSPTKNNRRVVLTINFQ